MKPRINKTGKAIIYSILITQAIVQLVLFIFFRNEGASTRTDYILNSFIFTIIGLLFGIILCIGAVMEENVLTYLLGQLFSFVILLALYLDGNAAEKMRAKKYENDSPAPAMSSSPPTSPN